MTTFDDRAAQRRERTASQQFQFPWFQTIASMEATAGCFIALIMLAGTRDAQLVAALLLVIAIGLSVLFVRRQLRRWEQHWERREALTLVAATRALADRLLSHQTQPEQRDA